MVSMKVIKATNEAFKASQHSKGLVGLFVGATSGIGEHTMKAFAIYSHSPQIYFVGRSQPEADRIIQETKTINPSASMTFIKADLTSIANVDKVSVELRQKEDKLHVLFMSPGFFSMAGWQDNGEGLDKKLSINYYSRMRFIHNLLPTLKSTATSSIFKPQVLSVLAVGRENPEILRNLISKNDLGLKKPENFSLRNAEAMTCTSNSLSLEELALQNPDLGFAHINPGIVITTNLARGLPLWARGLTTLFTPVLWPFADKAEDVGEGCVYLMTKGQTEVVEKKVDGAVEQNGNLYLGLWNGDDKADWRKKKNWEAERKALREDVVRMVGETFVEVEQAIEANKAAAAAEATT